MILSLSPCAGTAMIRTGGKDFKPVILSVPREKNEKNAQGAESVQRRCRDGAESGKIAIEVAHPSPRGEPGEH